ncbi:MULTISPECIES: tetratricopeptide repeat protein [Pseudomonas]|uniref:tetratricopeptide repeat protein n=1 Tax=Pseudomonas TaxID=286 RepID=UPI000C6EF56E|nr:MULTISPECIES: tetratricopeptide repeat protein [Pseudomonas]MDD1975534.1 tetratricopeptide repeat protein [Pseudomonas putida]QYX45862.1 tetratricopeptide repeat protein [Pseudomonas sp. S11A 273]
MKAVMVVMSLVLLGGCATAGGPPWAALAGSTASCAKPDSSQELALSMADEMLSEGRPHASLAHLEALPTDMAQVRLRKAKVLRLLGRSEAEPLYRSLLGGCLASDAEHGLGQLSAARGDNLQAQRHLLRAVRLAPTDEKVRNDLGVVYLNLGNVEQARFEFLTAIELKDNNTLAAVNLVSLLLYQDKWQQAADLVSRLNLTPAQFSEARSRAEYLKQPGKSSTARADQVAAVQ